MMRPAKDYGVEVIVSYENKRVGQVIYPPGTLRQRLVRAALVRERTSDADEPTPVKSTNQSRPTLKLTR